MTSFQIQPETNGAYHCQNWLGLARPVSCKENFFDQDYLASLNSVHSSNRF